MGPQERRLLSELAAYLVRSRSRTLRNLPPGTTLDLADHRRWFARAYHEWQLTPRVDLAGLAPYEVIAAERATAENAPKSPRFAPAVELFSDLAATDQPPTARPEYPSTTAKPHETTLPQRPDLTPMRLEATDPAEWQRLAQRLFGSWLDDQLDHL